MTREQEIEALAEDWWLKYISGDMAMDARSIFKAGILAGIALRDAELLEKFRELKQIASIEERPFPIEQFIKAIKGDK